MKFKAEINIIPLEALLDPQGKAITSSVKHLGFSGISNVRVGKHIILHIEAPDKKSAQSVVEDACAKLLCNAVMEKYSFTLTGI